MSPIDDKTKVVLPLSWVVSSTIGVTLFVCAFFFAKIQDLQADVHSLKTDVAVIKEIMVPHPTAPIASIK